MNQIPPQILELIKWVGIMLTFTWCIKSLIMFLFDDESPQKQSKMQSIFALIKKGFN